MRLPLLKFIPVLLLSAFTLAACDTEDPYSIPPPDFSTVPTAFDYSEADPIEIEEGVEAYILDEGEGYATVNRRDQIAIHITVRTLDDEIIYSSSANSNPEPDQMAVSNIQRVNAVQIYERRVPAYTPGLKAGLLGMKEGERRTIIVSPEKGYEGVSESSYTYQFRDDTLQYDIVLSSISY
ncbi:MAG: FKBP-type peptidyl-prolyl cis-trans isomerase [Balneolaceae bacterium]